MGEPKIPVTITFGEQKWEFNGEEADLLKNCSDFVKNLVDERISLYDIDDPEMLETILIEIPADIKFTIENLNEVITYLKAHKFAPPIYGKVESNDYTKAINDVQGQVLIEKYDLDNIKP